MRRGWKQMGTEVYTIQENFRKGPVLLADTGSQISCRSDAGSYLGLAETVGQYGPEFTGPTALSG